jgi:hypothetical protein
MRNSHPRRLRPTVCARSKKALAEANQNPLLIELKKIEVAKVRADRWNGPYPQGMINVAAAGLMLNAPPQRLNPNS